MPLWMLHGISAFLGFVAHRIVKYRVKVVRRNLANSFPEKSEKELRKIEHDFYRHLCDVIVETLKLLHISDKALRRRVVVTNPELVSATAASSPAIILFLGHYANWEWVPACTLSLDADITMGSIYKPLLSKVMGRLTDVMRHRLGITLIKSRNAYRTLLRMKAEGEPFMIGFIGDQRPFGTTLNHWTEFLGQPTAFVGGGETIGRRVGARFLYLDMEQKKRGYYSLTFREMEVSSSDDSEFPYTREFFRLLERTIRRAPAYWLWSHNRWKGQAPASIPARECRR